MVEIFFSYSHDDEELRDQLEKHLAPLKRDGVVAAWHDRKIVPGNPVDDTISHYLESAELILLLVSADFVASDYCYSLEMKRALERHDAGEARVVPVILRHCDWQQLPFGQLLAVPRDGRPITSWPDRDEAFTDVAKGIRRAAEEVSERRGPAAAQPDSANSPRSVMAAMPQTTADDFPRSSNLRVRKEFTDQERDKFRADAFAYISRFFETSLEELSQRNPEVQNDFRMINASRFEATAYIHGRRAAEMTVWLSRGDKWGGDIVYVQGRVEGDDTINGGLSIGDDGHALYLEPNVFFTLRARGNNERHLTFNGGAELLWEIFIEPLQT